MSLERFKIITAAHLLLIKNDSVLLLRRYNTGYEDGNYSVPAGHLDGGETVRATMAREAREEAGIIIETRDLEVVHVMHRIAGHERIDFFLTAKQYEGEPSIQELEKCDQLKWFPINNLPLNTISYVKQAIVNYLNGVYYSEFGW